MGCCASSSNSNNNSPAGATSSESKRCFPGESTAIGPAGPPEQPLSAHDHRQQHGEEVLFVPSCAFPSDLDAPFSAPPSEDVPHHQSSLPVSDESQGGTGAMQNPQQHQQQRNNSETDLASGAGETPPKSSSRRRSTHRHFSSTVLGAWAFDVAAARPNSLSGSFKPGISSLNSDGGAESPERLSGVPSAESFGGAHGAGGGASSSAQRTSLSSECSVSTVTAAPQSETATHRPSLSSQNSPYGAMSHRLSGSNATSGAFSAGSLTLNPHNSARSDATRTPRSPNLPRNPLERPTPRDVDVSEQFAGSSSMLRQDDSGQVVPTEEPTGTKEVSAATTQNVTPLPCAPEVSAQEGPRIPSEERSRRKSQKLKLQLTNTTSGSLIAVLKILYRSTRYVHILFNYT